MKMHSVRLAEVATLITDGTHLSPDYVSSGIAMLDSKHIGNDFSIDDRYAEKFISKETDDLLAQRCKPTMGDILISSRGTIGKIAIVKQGQNFNIMGNMILVRLNEEIDRRFFLHYLRKSLSRLMSISRGVAQKGLYLNQVRDLRVTFPPLAEQKRIAELLDTADNIMRLREQAIAKLDELAQSVFVDMFGDPVFNSKNIRTKSVKEICKLINGRAFKPTEWRDSGMPIIRIQNLNDESKNFNFTDQTFDEKYLVKKGDILFSWSGTPGTSFGCFKWMREDGWLNQHIFKVELNEEEVLPDFFIMQMNLKICELIAQAHGGVGLQHVTKGMVDDLLLLIPTMADQINFCERLMRVSDAKNKGSVSLQKCKSMLLSIQHQSFAVN